MKTWHIDSSTYYTYTHLHVPHDEHISLLYHKIKGFWLHCRVFSHVSFTPKNIFGFQLVISLSMVRFSMTGWEQRVVAWIVFPSGDLHTGIWYHLLPSTRYRRTPWIAAALGSVLQVSLFFSLKVLWTIWTVNCATLWTLCCIPLADNAGQFKALNVSLILGFIIVLFSKAVYRS